MIHPIPALDLALERDGARPVYRQIYARVREAILSGDLAPGARLPSARSLASQLGTARGTVDLAYHLLTGEGYVLARGAGGRIVDPQLRTGTGARATERHREATARPASQPALPDSAPLPFQMGLPALDEFPRKLW